VLEQNMTKLKQSCEKQAGIEFTNMEKGEEPFRGWKKKEIGEKKELEEEKMRLEYKFDLLNANKKKMKRSCKFMNNDIVIYGSKNLAFV
jgi:hypothetical protein